MYDYKFSDPSQAVMVRLRDTWTAVNKLAERELAKVGLTPMKTYILWVCLDYPGPLIPAEISRLFFRESHTIVGLLARMEKEGLVTRVPKRKGHPFTEIQITAKGEKLWHQGAKMTLALREKICSVLSREELEQLEGLLRKLQINVLEEMHLELKPPPNWVLTRVENIAQ